MALAMKPASQPMPSNSVRCTCASKLRPAPSARMMAYSRSRAWRLAPTAASNTIRPAARVKANRNSTARITWSMTRCTCASVLRMSTLVMLGKALTMAFSKPGVPSGERNAAM